MNAYYGSQELKDELMFKISEHERLDRYIQGTYWDKDLKKGCVIGCLYGNYYTGMRIHSKLREIYNIPTDLLYKIDGIFEALSVKDSKSWSARVFGAIKVGQDLSWVSDKFQYYFNTTYNGPKDDSDKLIEIINEV